MQVLVNLFGRAIILTLLIVWHCESVCGQVLTTIDCHTEADLIRAAKSAAGASIKLNILNPIILKHGDGRKPYVFGSKDKPAQYVELDFGQSGFLYSDANREAANMLAFYSNHTLIRNARVTGFQGYGAVFKNQFRLSKTFKAIGGEITECCSWPNTKDRWSAIFGGHELVNCESTFDGVNFVRCANDNSQHSHVIYSSSKKITIKNCKFVNCGQPIDCNRSLDSPKDDPELRVNSEAFFINNTIISHGAHNWDATAKKWTRCRSVFLVFGGRKYRIARNTVIGDFDCVYRGRASLASLVADDNTFRVNLKSGVNVEWKSAGRAAMRQNWGQWQKGGHDRNSKYRVRKTYDISR